MMIPSSALPRRVENASASYESLRLKFASTAPAQPAETDRIELSVKLLELPETPDASAKGKAIRQATDQEHNRQLENARIQAHSVRASVLTMPINPKSLRIVCASANNAGHLLAA